MISNLHELIAPLTEREFSDHLRNRTLKLQRSAGENRYTDLLDWDTLRGLVVAGTIPPDKFQVRKNTHNVPPVFYLQNTKVNAAKFGGLFEKGASLITDPIQTYVPSLKTLCDNISARTGEFAHADVIVTTGSGGALAIHYDPFDVIVLQVQGSKRWRIYGPPVIDPIKGMPEQDAPKNEPIFDEVLHPGDFIVMPGGYWHHCDNGPEVSLHVAIILRSPTGWHALKSLERQLLAEEVFRVPLSRFRDAAEKAAHEAAFKARLIERIEQMSLAEMAAEALKPTPAVAAKSH